MHNTLSVDTFDIAIVGYGPGAQCLAALLSRFGRSVVAFERYPHLYNLPRAGHIDHEAMRMVQSVGDADAFHDTLWEVRDEYVWLNARGDVLMLQPAHAPGDAISGWYSDFTQWQPNLESVFDTAARGAGVEVNLGWEVVGLQQRDDGVELVVNCVDLDESGRRERSEEYRRVRARYVVGADGASSFVRTTLGIARDDIGFNERWLDVDMHTLEPVEFRPNLAQICDPARPRLVMPLGRTHRRFEWFVFPSESSREMERPETAWALLEEFGVTPTTHEIARQIVYTFQARTAARWREGPVFISGDAAHTMPPYAGQGLLSSLRDSNNLAWKLDLVLQGKVSERLLDSYEEERRPHVAAWTQISLAEGRVSCEIDRARAAERDARLLAGESLDHPEPPKLSGGVLQRGELLAGTLGLQGRVRTLDGEGRFDDVLGASRFSVVVYGEDPRSMLGEAQLARLAELDAIVVGILPRGSEPAAGVAVDLDGRYGAYFAEHGMAAVVNRPDFYVFGAARSLEGLPRVLEELETCLT
jgi:2-polyprenyl-6-methoxyphenol hydroxylase-like FAD-dependent oxidoreductase